MRARLAAVETMLCPAGRYIMETTRIEGLDNYPREVADYLKVAIDELTELFVDESVENYGPEAFVALTGPIMLEQWLERGEMSYGRITESAFDRLIDDVIVEARFRKMKSLGLLDCIEDEHGKPCWFMRGDVKVAIAESEKFEGNKFRLVEKQIEITG